MVKNLASTGKRVLGALIDLTVVALIFLVFGIFFGTWRGLSVDVVGIPALFLFLIWFLYYVAMEAKTGKTVGKYVVNTRVVNEAGKKITWKQSVIRNLMRFIDGIIFYLVGFIAIVASKDKQRLGDMLAKTLVVDD